MAVTKNSTKAQILNAYEELLKEVEEKTKDNPKEMQERKQQKELVSKAEKNSEKNILEYITKVKNEFISSLDTIEINLSEERQKLETIQKAIKIEEKHLEDLYGIKINADSFATMLLMQKQQKESFEKEMQLQKEQLTEEISTIRDAWGKEKAMQKEALKGQDEILKKTRLREEEEYNYTLEQKRKKDQDSYQLKKTEEETALKNQRITFEKEFSEREKKINESEKELNDLRVKVAQFPEELEKIVTKTKELTKKELEVSYKYERSLQAKETEGAVNLKNHQINSLEEKIKEMEGQLKEAGIKVDNSEKTVKDIALKAIETKNSPQFIERQRDVKE